MKAIFPNEVPPGVLAEPFSGDGSPQSKHTGKNGSNSERYFPWEPTQLTPYVYQYDYIQT